MALLSQISILESCTAEFVENTVLNKKQFKTVLRIQDILFPKGKNIPSAKDFNAHLYLIWVLSDENILKEDRQYLKDGIRWVEETAQEEYQTDFLNLSKTEQEKLILFISKKNWGENWLSYMLSYIIEAMVSDPIYGFNTNAVGVKWLQHQYGIPRPTKTTKYPEIFKTVAKNES